jgi:hypothetical protein
LPKNGCFDDSFELPNVHVPKGSPMVQLKLEA